MKTADTQTRSCTTKFTRSHFSYGRFVFAHACRRTCKHYSMSFPLILLSMCHRLRLLHHYSSFRDRITVPNSILLNYWVFYKWDEALCQHTPIPGSSRISLLEKVTSFSPPNTHLPVNLNNSDRLFLRAYVTSYITHQCQIITRIIIILIRNTYLAPVHKQAQHILLSSVSVIICGPIHKWDCYFLRWCNTLMANFLLLCHSILFTTYSYFPFTHPRPLYKHLQLNVSRNVSFRARQNTKFRPR